MRAYLEEDDCFMIKYSDSFKGRALALNLIAAP